MAGLLDGKVAIITGAGRGIGAAAAALFAEHGAKVVVSDIDIEPAKAVVDGISQSGYDAVEICGDITDPKFPELLVSETLAKYGTVNIIVNNAGYSWDGMLHKMTDKQFSAMLEVHNIGPFRLIRAAASHMRQQAKKEKTRGEEPKSRCIINVSSTSGLHGNIGQVNYSTAKMGLVGMTKTIAREWGVFGIRCNAVAFGFIDTRLTREKESSESIEVDGQQVKLGMPGKLRETVMALIPLGRPGTIEEAAGAILFLASPLASYITGHTLEVTGGMGI
ncbi:MAG: SDR family NAD(P)-dependent oxidoreductase [Planctomycetota bacterium]|jgi:3-oxoacyl-[acyl-carrier protein] reductase